MSWPEIARTQAAHGHALCGMYAPAQLAHWGQSPPAGPCARLAAAASLALALSALLVRAQTPAAVATATLSGTVRMASANGKVVPVPYATVLLTST